MLVKANTKYIRVSPYKLRPVVDVIRGYSVDKALAWLQTNSLRKVMPVRKTLLSAYANGKNILALDVPMDQFFIKEIKVDQGPTVKYFKPGAMGRASIQRRRLSHLQIILEKKEVKK
ncbi:50S ribosomal protein L22 [Candidatus Dependentiae bacterium]|nr:50S ribosomal protein L22 [Candidatus Dependentiae bacterium]MBU4387584.1 50S ribosomal protein L22 [Candidatus Dependentiae bacterium]MCG2756294.1 50S ribosomal protein L22 [Candidatus Dependentiae bacterium]